MEANKRIIEIILINNRNIVNCEGIFKISLLHKIST